MTDAPIANTFPHRTPKGPRPRKPPDPDAPAHYRLSTETWEIILKEYREGATASFLASKWRVSVHGLRRRITRHNATKRDWGDAQAIGQAVAREAELEEARRNSPEAVAARLFDGIGPLNDDAAGDPAALLRGGDAGVGAGHDRAAVGRGPGAGRAGRELCAAGGAGMRGGRAGGGPDRAGTAGGAGFPEAAGLAGL